MKRLFKDNVYLFGILAVAVFTCIVMFSYNKSVALVELAIFAALVGLALVSNIISLKNKDEAVSSINRTFDFSEKDNLKDFPMPVLVCTAGGRILWYNTLFGSRVLGDYTLMSDDVTQFLNGHSAEEISPHDSRSRRQRLYYCKNVR